MPVRPPYRSLLGRIKRLPSSRWISRNPDREDRNPFDLARVLLEGSALVLFVPNECEGSGLLFSQGCTVILRRAPDQKFEKLKQIDAHLFNLRVRHQLRDLGTGNLPEFFKGCGAEARWSARFGP